MELLFSLRQYHVEHSLQFAAVLPSRFVCLTEVIVPKLGGEVSDDPHTLRFPFEWVKRIRGRRLSRSLAKLLSFFVLGFLRVQRLAIGGRRLIVGLVTALLLCCSLQLKLSPTQSRFHLLQLDTRLALQLSHHYKLAFGLSQIVPHLVLVSIGLAFLLFLLL